VFIYVYYRFTLRQYKEFKYLIIVIYNFIGSIIVKMLSCIKQSENKYLPIEPAIEIAQQQHGTSIYNTQNDLLLHKVLRFYNENGNMEKMLAVINGETNISLRIIDWFATNYAKKHYTVYELQNTVPQKRFKVYVDYKLKLRAYSKKRFDPFCRWDRINVPYKNNTYIQTTLGQLNFFKWAIENEVIRYIQENYTTIEADMNIRNNTSRKAAKSHHTSSATIDGCEIKMDTMYNNYGEMDENNIDENVVYDTQSKTSEKSKHRKKREELSISATKSIKKEMVNIVLSFN
jgi:hypothetical protein